MARWGRSYGNDSMWAPYVQVAQRRAKAEREAAKLRAKGVPVAPVTIDGRTIAHTVWGKGWCDSLELHADWINRLARGRTYVRNGSVVDLQVGPGQVDAVVAGSEPYKVAIAITPMDQARWQRIAADCAGKVASLVELLAGRLDKATLARLCDRKDGLYPQPREMTFRCSCPDSAHLCKHVAAALYGVGNRLDSTPELLFALRQIDAGILLAEVAGVGAGIDAGAGEFGDDADLAAIFGVEFGDAALAAIAPNQSLAAAPTAETDGAKQRPSNVKGGPPKLGRDEKLLLTAFAEHADEELQIDAVLMLALVLSVPRTHAALTGLHERQLVERVVDADKALWWRISAAGLAAAKRR